MCVKIYNFVKIMVKMINNILLDRITMNPNICHGKPTVRGMRYTVQSVLELLASGMTNSEILSDYEDLEEDDLKACLLFAAKISAVKSISQLVA
jgi:uncharacterized protein (DUF433 family)